MLFNHEDRAKLDWLVGAQARDFERQDFIWKGIKYLERMAQKMATNIERLIASEAALKLQNDGLLNGVQSLIAQDNSNTQSLRDLIAIGISDPDLEAKLSALADDMDAQTQKNIAAAASIGVTIAADTQPPAPTPAPTPTPTPTPSEPVVPIDPNAPPASDSPTQTVTPPGTTNPA